jgi:hypothetical protein
MENKTVQPIQQLPGQYDGLNGGSNGIEIWIWRIFNPMDLQWPCARNGIASNNQYRKGLELGKILPPSGRPETTT